MEWYKIAYIGSIGSTSRVLTITVVYEERQFHFDRNLNYQNLE